MDVERPQHAGADGTDADSDVEDGGVTQCVSKTCAQLGASCGSIPGCGRVIPRGKCPAKVLKMRNWEHYQRLDARRQVLNALVGAGRNRPMPEAGLPIPPRGLEKEPR